MTMYKPRPAGDILSAVCREFMVTRANLMTKKNRSASAARYAACLALRWIPARLGTQRSYPQIGRVMSRHHTTIMYNERCALILMTENINFLRRMARILGPSITPVDTVKKIDIHGGKEQTDGSNTGKTGETESRGDPQG